MSVSNVDQVCGKQQSGLRSANQGALVRVGYLPTLSLRGSTQERLIQVGFWSEKGLLHSHSGLRFFLYVVSTIPSGLRVLHYVLFIQPSRWEDYQDRFYGPCLEIHHLRWLSSALTQPYGLFNSRGLRRCITQCALSRWRENGFGEHCWSLPLDIWPLWPACSWGW